MSSLDSEDSANPPTAQGGSPENSKRTGGYFPSPRGDKVVELVDLDEIQTRWGVTEYRVYRAVALGYIKAYGRPGRQKYYSAAEIEAWLSSSVIGRQLSWPEFNDDSLSA